MPISCALLLMRSYVTRCKERLQHAEREHRRSSYIYFLLKNNKHYMYTMHHFNHSAPIDNHTPMILNRGRSPMVNAYPLPNTIAHRAHHTATTLKGSM